MYPGNHWGKVPMLLRKDDPWLKNLPIPDIRNWRVVDRDGAELGFVETLVVDRQENAFEALLIGANDRFTAIEVEIEDSVVRVTRSLRRRTDGADDLEGFPSNFEKSYRRHYERTYEGGTSSFETLLPAYRFGREIVSDADIAGRSFAAAEEDLKARYVAKKIQPPWESARAAIKTAYNLVHRMR